MKQKTKQAARKRFYMSSTGKVRRRHTKQAHFNSRATGEEGRDKHAALLVHPSNMSHIQQLLPNDHK